MKQYYLVRKGHKTQPLDASIQTNEEARETARKLLGITADIDDIAQFQAEFTKAGGISITCGNDQIYPRGKKALVKIPKNHEKKLIPLHLSQDKKTLKRIKARKFKHQMLKAA